MPSFKHEQEALSQKKPDHSKPPGQSTGRETTVPHLSRQFGNQALNRIMRAEPSQENGHPKDSLEDRLGFSVPILRQQYGITEPDDPIEREASSVANQIVNMQPQNNEAALETGGEPRIWRQPTISRKSETSDSSHQAVDLDLPSIDSAPLERSVASYMEPRFGYSFNDVRIHTGSQSSEISRDLNARAFTIGSDIYFGHQEYNPQTQQGKELIAHELTHVVQQGKAKQVSPASIARVKAGEPQKTLTLNITKLDGSSRTTDVSDASKILESAANIKIVQGKVETLDKAKSEALIGADLVLDEFTTFGTATAEETALTAVNRTADTITAYLVKSLSQGSHGEALWPAAFTGIPASVAIKDGDSPFVAGKPLAHELVHILLGKETHPSDVTNLMSYSNTGVGLEPSEKTTARGSSYVK